MSLTRLAAGMALAALTILPSHSMGAEVIDLTPPRLMPDAPGIAPGDSAAAGESRLSFAPTPAREQYAGDGGSSDSVELQPMLPTRHFGAQVTLSCAVADTPNDLVLVNRGLDPLPAGTRIKWQIRSAGLVGYFAIIGPLGPGEKLVADDVVAGQPDGGASCVARAI